jgi:hypothetical protein
MEGERERTIHLLSEHFAHDNLTVEELEHRIELTYRASSVPALREITRDLPDDAAAAQANRAVAVPEAFALERDRIIAVMSETKRSGPWRVPKRLDAWCVMSDTELDLSEAQLPSGVTEIHLRALMAAVRVIVPRGVRVVLQPGSVMSSVGFDEDEMAQPPVGSGAPVIRITGPVVMSEVTVKVRVALPP